MDKEGGKHKKRDSKNTHQNPDVKNKISHKAKRHKKKRKIELPNHQPQKLDNRWEEWELHNNEQRDSVTEPGMTSMLKWIARICVGTGIWPCMSCKAHHYMCAAQKSITAKKLSKDLPIWFMCSAQPPQALGGQAVLFADLSTVSL